MNTSREPPARARTSRPAAICCRDARWRYRSGWRRFRRARCRRRAPSVGIWPSGLTSSRSAYASFCAHDAVSTMRNGWRATTSAGFDRGRSRSGLAIERIHASLRSRVRHAGSTGRRVLLPSTSIRRFISSTETSSRCVAIDQTWPKGSTACRRDRHRTDRHGAPDGAPAATARANVASTSCDVEHQADARRRRAVCGPTKPSSRGSRRRA